MLDRRAFVLAGAAGLFGGLIAPRRAAAQAEVVLNGLLSLVASSGTNVLAFAAPDGLVLVDSGIPTGGDPLMVSLGRLSSGGRVRTVFNTHFHLDNTGANEVLRQSGATIIAHENTRLWMATPVWTPSEDRYRPARPKAAQPSETFRTTGSMTAGRERIDYGYMIDAHTSGDIYVFFRDSNVLAVGDVASPTRDPELDYLTGAWIGGRIDAMTKLLALCSANTRIVPGFGPVMSRADLQAEHDVMKKIYDRVVERIRQGDDAEDMLEAGVMSGLGRTWNDPKKFLYDVQKGLWAHHNKLNANVV